MVLLFLGVSGSGKDTQAEMLGEKFGFEVVSTGDLLREEVKKGSDLGRVAKMHMDKGEWVPDIVVYKVLEGHLGALQAPNIVLTGVVRTPEQVAMLDATLSTVGRQLDKVVFFELGEDEAVKRLSGRWYSPNGNIYHEVFNPPRVAGKDDDTGEPLFQRDDDKPGAIKQRFAEFRSTVQPILDAYEKRGILITVDAGPGIEEIASVLQSHLGL